MALNPLQRLRLWLARSKARAGKSKPDSATSFNTTTQQEPQDAATVMLSGVRLVFGLEWNPLAAGAEIEESLQEARNAGYNYGALMSDGSLVGLARDIGQGRGKAYSAVLIMLEQLSSSEVEMFVFQIGTQVCFVGLVDRKPVAGFDLLLPGIPEALEVMSEFRSIHVGHDIRVVTNLKNELPNGEQVRLDSLLTLLGPQLLVKRLINRPLRRVIATVTILTIVLAGAITWYLYDQAEQRRRMDEEARLAHESDPNVIYERAINGLLRQAGTPGNLVLNQWREMVEALPLAHAGWVLAAVECRAIGCKATWVRFHGNFQEFDRRKPAYAIDLAELDKAGANSSTDNLLQITLETHHQLSVSAADEPQPMEKPAGLDRQQLPLLRDATLQWGSVLQDWAMLGVKVRLGKSVLFAPPGLTDPAPIHKPVVMMPWEIEDGIWSLPAVDLPADAIPESLTVTMQDLKASYKLTGTLYAKAKNF